MDSGFNVLKRAAAFAAALALCALIGIRWTGSGQTSHVIARAPASPATSHTTQPTGPGVAALFRAFPECARDFWPTRSDLDWSHESPSQLAALQLPPSPSFLGAHLLYMNMASELRTIGVDFFLARESLLHAQRHMSPVPWGGATVLWVDASRFPFKLRSAAASVARRMGAVVAVNDTKTLALQLDGATALVLALYDHVGQYITVRAPQSKLEYNVSASLVQPASARRYGCDPAAPVPLATAEILAEHYLDAYGLFAHSANAAESGSADPAGKARAVGPCGSILGSVPWAMQQANAADALVRGADQLRDAAPQFPTALLTTAPKILHLFAPVSGLLPLALRSCYAVYPGWSIRVWNLKTIPFEPQSGSAARAFLANEQLSSLGSFLMLLEIQRVYGGLVVSGNVTCTTALPSDALNASFTAVLGIDGAGSAIDAVVAASPSHAHIHAMLQRLGPRPTEASFAALRTWTPTFANWRPVADVPKYFAGFRAFSDESHKPLEPNDAVRQKSLILP